MRCSAVILTSTAHDGSDEGEQTVGWEGNRLGLFAGVAKIACRPTALRFHGLVHVPRMLESSPPVQMFQFSTKAFAERERLTAWREVFGRTVCSLDIGPLEPSTFSSDATIYQLPGLGALFAASGAMDLSHTRELIADDDLSFMAAPTCGYTASQLGRTVELEPGAGVLMTKARRSGA